MPHPTMLLREPGAEPDAEAGSESGKEAGGKTTSPLRLRNPRWDRERAPAGGKAIASVEAALPEAEWRTRVVFTWWELHADGTRTEHGAADGHILRGKAWALFRVPGTAGGGPDGETPGRGETRGGDGEARRFLFTARHSLSREVEGPILVVDSRPRAFDGMLLYSPLRGAYLVLETREQAGPWLEEFRAMRALRGGTRRAWEIRDAAERLAALRDLCARAAGLFRDSRVGIWSQGPLEELLVLRPNPGWGASDAWVHVRSRTLGRAFARRGWRRTSEAAVQPILDGLLQPAPGMDACPWLEPDMRQRFFATDPVPGMPWDWQRTVDAPRNSEAFRFEARAIMTRYLIGWDGTRAGWDSGLRRRLRSVSAQASCAIPPGTLTGDWHWPEEAGLDLLESLAGVKYLERYLRAGRSCRLRRTVSAGKDFLVGASLSEVLGFPAFVASGRWRALRIGYAWSPASDLGFVPLAASAETAAAAPKGTESPFGIAWDGRRFLISASGDMAARLGCRERVAFALPPGEGADLIGHLLQAVDFHFVTAVDAGAYRAYADFHLARLALGGELPADRAAGAMAEVRDFPASPAAGSGGPSGLEERLRRAASFRGMLRRAPPDALAKAMTALMRVRDSRNLGAVLGMLAASGDSGLGTDRHKSKWVLRLLSGLAIPPRGHAGREAAKSRALAEGLRRVRDFGNGARIPGWEGREDRDQKK